VPQKPHASHALLVRYGAGALAQHRVRSSRLPVRGAGDAAVLMRGGKAAVRAMRQICVTKFGPARDSHHQAETELRSTALIPINGQPLPIDSARGVIAMSYGAAISTTLIAGIIAVFAT